MSASLQLTFFDYHRTVIGFHGTTRRTANRLVEGGAFNQTTNDDDWFGHGCYFWEHAPRQAWWWATQFKRYRSPAVVGAIIRLGNCFDLLDPQNVRILRRVHDTMWEKWPDGVERPQNGNQHKKIDCAVFNYLYQLSEDEKTPIDSARAVYVPTASHRRVWPRSWIYEQAHIQICVRNRSNILAVWHVRKDGSYGKD